MPNDYGRPRSTPERLHGHCFTEVRFFKWQEDDVSVSLRASGASYGGERSAIHLLYTDTVGALCSVDYKGAGRQYVDQGKLVIEVIATQDGDI